MLPDEAGPISGLCRGTGRNFYLFTVAGSHFRICEGTKRCFEKACKRKLKSHIRNITFCSAREREKKKAVCWCFRRFIHYLRCCQCHSVCSKIFSFNCTKRNQQSRAFFPSHQSDFPPLLRCRLQNWGRFIYSFLKLLSWITVLWKFPYHACWSESPSNIQSASMRLMQSDTGCTRGEPSAFHRISGRLCVSEDLPPNTPRPQLLTLAYDTDTYVHILPVIFFYFKNYLVNRLPTPE